jgi:hypothetical protein
VNLADDVSGTYTFRRRGSGVRRTSTLERSGVAMLLGGLIHEYHEVAA